MTQSPEVPTRLSAISRRQFNQIIALTTLATLTREIAFPAIAHADTAHASATDSIAEVETYHIFVGDKIAQEGGDQKVTLRSGFEGVVTIPPPSRFNLDQCLDNISLSFDDAGLECLEGGDVVFVLHTLNDPLIDTDGLIKQALTSAPLLDATYHRCWDVYHQVTAGNGVNDLQALSVLDTIISESYHFKKPDESKLVKRRYQIASQHARLLKLQTYIEDAIDKADLTSEKKQKLKGIYQYIRANEPLPRPNDFKDLTYVDAIVQGASLPVSLCQQYAMASALTRAYTADDEIQHLIRHNPFTKHDPEPYLKEYNDIRIGKEVKHQCVATSLDMLIDTSNISDESKTIYKLARNRFFQEVKDKEQAKQAEQDVEKDLNFYLDIGQKAAKRGSKVVPIVTQVFQAGGVTAGTGTAISSLTGAAATNASLATLGGGSVATGGLGMMGGLAIATVGAAIVGASVLVSVSLVAGMSHSEQTKLGVAATAGTLASMTIMGTAWAVTSTFIIAGNLTGAAAISSVIATLGGVSTITGGAALIALGVGFGVWQLLKDDDATLKAALQQVEATLYTISDAERFQFPLVEILKEHLQSSQTEMDKIQDKKDEIYLTPGIPIYTLANAISRYANFSDKEKALAIVNLSSGKKSSGKRGMIFTDRGLWWRDSSSSSFVAYSDPDYLFKIKDLPSVSSRKKEKELFDLAVEIGRL